MYNWNLLGYNEINTMLVSENARKFQTPFRSLASNVDHVRTDL
jgi:hypothetical protein